MSHGTVRQTPDDPVGDLTESNVQRGLHIDARTGASSWRGERFNVGYAIDVLHPLANPGLYTGHAE